MKWKEVERKNPEVDEHRPRLAEDGRRGAKVTGELVDCALAPHAALAVADGNGELEEVIVVDDHACCASEKCEWEGGKRVERASHEGKTSMVPPRDVFPSWVLLLASYLAWHK